MHYSPNDQFNFATADSLAARVAARVRAGMFALFMREFNPTPKDRTLDVGVTSDRTYSHSNYFENSYPYKDNIVAVGLQDASFLEAQYPGLKYVCANGLDLPFADRSFDLVHSSAVLEHVGKFDNQARMIRECLRVARRGICLTTPNRWFPIELHTQLPLVHWLPKPACRGIMRKLGCGPLAEEENLNLMQASELRRITAPLIGWRFKIASARLLGWKSNLILLGHQNLSPPRGDEKSL